MESFLLHLGGRSGEWVWRDTVQEKYKPRRNQTNLICRRSMYENGMGRYLACPDLLNFVNP